MRNKTLKNIDNAINRIQKDKRQIQRSRLFTQADKEALIPYYQKHIDELRLRRDREIGQIVVTDPVFIRAEKAPLFAVGF